MNTEPYFDVERFLEDVLAHASRHQESHREIAAALGIGANTLRAAITQRTITLRTACLLADWADLSLDTYRVLQIGLSTPLLDRAAIVAQNGGHPRKLNLHTLDKRVTALEAAMNERSNA